MPLMGTDGRIKDEDVEMADVTTEKDYVCNKDLPAVRHL
jgi:hypothetical protein